MYTHVMKRMHASLSGICAQTTLGTQGRRWKLAHGRGGGLFMHERHMASTRVHGHSMARGIAAAATRDDHGNTAAQHGKGGTGSDTKASGQTLVADGSRLAWQRPDLAVVLVNPQIPQNCGNIARTCAATKVALHLVGPLGFELNDTKLKRAGLDYWDWVAVKVHTDIESFLRFYSGLQGEKSLVAFSKFGDKHYAAEGLYNQANGTRCFLMFGAETTGLPDIAHDAATDVVKIPMHNFEHVRSLNLATSVGIGLFEALRQKDGADFLPEISHTV